jgi:hypothetical protein
MLSKDSSELKTTPHFVKKGDIPELASSATFAEMMNGLKDAGTRDLIITIDASPKYYVKGNVFAERLQLLYENEKDFPHQESFANLMQEVPDAVFRLMDIPKGTATVAALQDDDDAVFAVQGGWFLNHEKFSYARTQPFTIKCTGKTKDAPHENYSRRVTGCRVCGAPLEK